MQVNRALSILNAIIFSSVQEIFVILSFGFAFGIIYLIGDTRQLYPLLEGLIAGTVFFSLLYVLSRKDSYKRVLLFSCISLTLVLISFAISYLFHRGYGYDFEDDLLFIQGVMISSILLPVQQYTHFLFHIDKISAKGLTAGTSSLLMIVGVIIFSFIYEKEGQIMLPRMVDEIAAVAVAIALAEFVLLQGKKA
ncbi:MAG: hypothetical protein QXN66_06455 [Thermoplasmatales archaeon]